MITSNSPSLPSEYRMQVCVEIARIADRVLIALPVIGDVISVFSWQIVPDDSPEDLIEMYRR